MSSEAQKRQVAEAALEFVRSGDVLGVGSGSTVNCFIAALASVADQVPAAVSASEASSARLRAIDIQVVELNQVECLPVYIDGADEFEPGLSLVKGGGAALTGEKILASVAETFVCIVDESKRVDVLGEYPVPLEVIPMAVEAVCRRVRELGGDPRLRPETTTDHGNPIVDVGGLCVTDPLAVELELETIPGVVTCGVFARRGADIVLMASDRGVQRFG
ncbi:MAG TPA: ribose-5-phosphate isomerase RpiA [Acidobacteriota bacterium]|nr:ribose-5-phosphate isomerase RpiA [Acidobacteriota bacterium]